MTCTAQNSGTYIKFRRCHICIMIVGTFGLVRRDHHLHGGASFCNLIGASTI